jgi:hypothetical protein
MDDRIGEHEIERELVRTANYQNLTVDESRLPRDGN